MALARRRLLSPEKFDDRHLLVRKQDDDIEGINKMGLLIGFRLSYGPTGASLVMLSCHTGSSPHQYLLELRLARARNLLEETSLSVKEVAQNAGFEDEHYFCRFFKQKTGRTPGQWRSRLKARRSP